MSRLLVSYLDKQPQCVIVNDTLRRSRPVAVNLTTTTTTTTNTTTNTNILWYKWFEIIGYLDIKTNQ